MLDALDALPGPQRRALEVALLLAEAESTPPDPRAVALGALTLLEHVALERPVMLAIDDVQWLDSASANVLTFAVRRMRSERIRVLVAQRVEPQADASRWASIVRSASG